MLVIRMQRTGRKGHAQFRVVVQDSRRTPTSGKVVASLGHYNPHTKETSLNKETVSFYLEHGAQPSDRVVRLLKAEGVKLPNWVRVAVDKERVIRNSDKLRKNRPVTEVEKPVEVSDDQSDVNEATSESAVVEPVTEQQSASEESSELETPTGVEVPESENAIK